ncbi:AraC family transcriptional regulator [Lysinibacillus sp. FSL K6-0232]|uniref:helix-turn-helix transcriptional regulator n=1 Tax=Lysinibacillus sp. FSL K6-0232 TaxID=2921425 RepID=UPI0030FCEF79
MKAHDQGTLPQSKIFFTMANEFTKENLYYIIYSGTFHCTTEYKITRENFHSFLFLYIKQGQMKIQHKGKEFIAAANSFVFLDCHFPHCYEAITDHTIFDWFHFSGNASREYFDLLYNKHDCVYAIEEQHIILDYMNRILRMAETNHLDEHYISLYIQHILCELNQFSQLNNDTSEKKVRQAVHFIESNYHKDIKLEDISNHVYLSPYYFTRIFNKHLDCSPVQYLINYRINQAKKMLHNSNSTINEIAFMCGFNSTSHFITTFKKHVHLSPKKFRDIHF